MRRCIFLIQRLLLYPALRTNVCQYQNASLSTRRTHYDVLELNRSCSCKEIKKAYFKLCKELHPDVKPGDSTQHKKFVELNNAYNTLLSADSRKIYDRDLAYQTKTNDRKDFGMYSAGFNQQSDHYMHRNCWRDESIWSMRNKSKYRYGPNSPYYGTPGLKRVDNKWIVVCCFFLIFLGSMLYLAAYRFSLNCKINVDRRSAKINEAYLDVKIKAQQNGKEKQINKFRKAWNLPINQEAVEK